LHLLFADDWAGRICTDSAPKQRAGRPIARSDEAEAPHELLVQRTDRRHVRPRNESVL